MFSYFFGSSDPEPVSPDPDSSLQSASFASSDSFYSLADSDRPTDMEFEIRHDDSNSQILLEKSASSKELNLEIFPPVFIIPPIWVIISTILTIVVIALFCTEFSSTIDSIGLTPRSLLEYASIPLISVVFTYFHIWLALWMTFFPIEYVGACQIPSTNCGLGWQGIIPWRAEKMARISVRLLTTQLISIREIFGRLESERVVRALLPVLDPILQQSIASVFEACTNAEVWVALPSAVKQELINQVKEDSPLAVEELLKVFKSNIDELLDIEQLVVDRLVSDRALLNRLFIRCGYSELLFIRNSGAVMGFLFGLIQIVVWRFYPAPYIIVLFGLVVGVITNWLALLMIFNPIEPVNFCGFRIHGLFLSRQFEVSAEYSHVITRELLNARSVFASLQSGACADRLMKLVEHQVEKSIERIIAARQESFSISNSVSRFFLKFALGGDRAIALKKALSEEIARQLPICLQSLEEYAEEALDLERTIRDKMRLLKSKEFERLLHPVFEEDEWKLIAVPN